MPRPGSQLPWKIRERVTDDSGLAKQGIGHINAARSSWVETDGCIRRAAGPVESRSGATRIKTIGETGSRAEAVVLGGTLPLRLQVPDTKSGR